jgi:hypothetical protein
LVPEVCVLSVAPPYWLGAKIANGLLELPVYVPIAEEYVDVLIPVESESNVSVVMPLTVLDCAAGGDM